MMGPIEYIPFVMVLFVGSPDWTKYTAQYKTGHETYIECKKFTLSPIFKETVRMLYENPKPIARVKTGCKMRMRSTRLGAESI